ncbi:DUF6624 domain-containing protein [Streptomyces sp. NPDC004647]|uniref:DUF6624 domain-containing protein n=1 Tax=Streptomyces sp. NPDC004647 TaxID=3154671 RepID=UPI0033A13A4D
MRPPRRLELPHLEKELLQLASDSQQIRRREPVTVGELRAREIVDIRNTQALGRIVDEHGWPGHRLVGVNGAAAAWLIAHHSDHDLAFQLRALGLLERAVQRGDATLQQLAYLTDRTRLRTGIPQIFGTQYVLRHGACVLWDVEQPEGLERRRRDAGLPPMAEYASLLRSGTVRTIGGDA